MGGLRPRTDRTRRVWLIRWLLSILGWYRDPSKLKNLEAATNMQGIVTLNWTLGPVGNRQLAIDHVRIEGREVTSDNSLPWTKEQDVPAATLTLEVDNVAPGEWEYRGIPVDVQGNEGDPLEVQVTMPADKPSQLASLTAVAS